MIPGLSLIGSGTDSCVVDCRNFPPQGLHAVEVADGCLIKGFYIRSSNNSNYGEGIYATGQNGLITENMFSDANTGISLWESSVKVYKNYLFNVRIGIDVFNSNSIVRKNEIYPNSDPGRGVSVDAYNNNFKPIIDSNYIVSMDGHGIYKSFGARPIIINNEIITIGIGIQLSSSDSAIVNNNTIVVPGGIESGYGIYNTATQYLRLHNNQISGAFLFRILYIGPDNNVKNNVISNAEGEIRKWGSQNLIYQYNNVWNSAVSYAGFVPDTTNLSVDPMVANDDSTQGNLDFHLQKYSPLIDAGDPNILDKDGSRSDIGLYGGPYGESYIYVDLPPRPPVNLTVVVDTLIKLKWNQNTEADFSYYNLYRDTTSNFTIDSTKLVASPNDTFYHHIIPFGVESLYFKLTGVDNQGNESNPSEEVGVLITSVKDEWRPLNNYVLYQNYPNPFNPRTKIGYKLKERGYVKLYVYDIKGELVSVLVNQTQEAGYYEVEFDAGSRIPDTGIQSLASGVYIYQIFVSNDNRIPIFSDVKKMLLVK
jgi:hypothetical protein